MKKQNIIVMAAIAFILAVAVGYAIFSQTLTIDGTATAKGSFDVVFTSVGEITKVGYTATASKGEETPLPIATISTDKHTLTINVNKFDYPGAYVEIPVTVTNIGTITAVLESIEETGLVTDSSVKVSYTNLAELKDQQLSKDDTQTFKIKVEWDSNNSQSAENSAFNIKLNYKQSTNISTTSATE